MRGSFGMLCIALGILAAGLGGYLLNAETVTVCETEWDYVTDIGAAFQGDKADMDIEYNPSSNITGWSDKAAYNNRHIQAVDYRQTDRANIYQAYTTATVYENASVNVAATSTDGMPNTGFSFDGVPYGTMPDWAGLYNYEVWTVAEIGGVRTTGAFAVPLSDIVEYAGLSDWDYFDVSVSSSNYPAFAVGDITFNTSTQGGTNHLVETFSAAAYSTSVTAIRAERSAVIGDAAYPIQDVYLVFGHASINGQADRSVSVSFIKSKGSQQVFLDPAYGFTPKSGSYEMIEVTEISHPTSASPSIVIEVPPNGLGYGRATIDIAYQSEGAPGQLGTVVAYYEADSPLYPTIMFTPQGGTAVLAVGDDQSGARMVIGCSSGSWSISSGGSTLGTFTGPATYESISASATIEAGYRYSLTIYNDGLNPYIMTYEGSQTITASMAYTTETTETTTHTYDKAYWNNNHDNVSVSIALARPSSGSGSAEFVFYGSERNGSLRVIYESGEWALDIPNETNVPIGNWPAILVKIEGETATAYPLTAFTSFTSYENVLGPAGKIYVTGPGLDMGTISHFRARDTGANLRMSVVSTTIRLAEGGLYLQNGTLDLQSSFPGTVAASLMIGSAAAVGDSVTFKSGNRTVTLPVDASALTITIGNSAYELNGITFRWYSSSGPSASVSGVTYAPAIYDRGSVLDSGVIWAETKRGDYIQVLEAPSGWEVTLDGVWAPSAFFYTGENVASESTQISDITKGEFRWDKDTTLIFMMGAAIVGGLVGTHWGYTKAADWIVIFGAVGVCWLIL